jgi:hypothetical protein
MFLLTCVTQSADVSLVFIVFGCLFTKALGFFPNRVAMKVPMCTSVLLHQKPSKQTLICLYRETRLDVSKEQTLTTNVAHY